MDDPKLLERRAHQSTILGMWFNGACVLIGVGNLWLGWKMLHPATALTGGPSVIPWPLISSLSLAALIIASVAMNARAWWLQSKRAQIVDLNAKQLSELEAIVNPAPEAPTPEGDRKLALSLAGELCAFLMEYGFEIEPPEYVDDGSLGLIASPDDPKIRDAFPAKFNTKMDAVKVTAGIQTFAAPKMCGTSLSAWPSWPVESRSSA